jgi:hypothetical protein
METLLAVIALGAPVVILVALFRAIGGSQRRRHAAIARQIHLTDALHARIGAALAPVVVKPLGRPWQVLVTAPFESTEVVSTLLETVGEEFAARDPQHPEAFQVVLSPREKPVAHASHPAAARARRLQVA